MVEPPLLPIGDACALRYALAAAAALALVATAPAHVLALGLCSLSLLSSVLARTTSVQR